MSYKQRAQTLLTELGATETESWYDECWIMDYQSPKGKRWVENGEHLTWTRENTLTDCWKTLIATARLGFENCPADCDCFIEVQPLSEIEQARMIERERELNERFASAANFVREGNANFVMPTLAERKAIKARLQMRAQIRAQMRARRK